MSAAEKVMAALPDVIRWGDESSEPVGLERAYVDLVAAVARLSSSLSGLEHQLAPITRASDPIGAGAPSETTPGASQVVEAVSAQTRRIEGMFLAMEELRSRLEV